MTIPFYVLSLDGGGAKGVYTLGILKELEGLLGKKLYEQFNLIYGTSTGAIISILLSLGWETSKISELYFSLIPKIMKSCNKKGRSKALQTEVKQMLGDKTFTECKTDVGIVTTHIDYARPMIFKTSINQAYGRTATWKPGFGSTLAEAVIASCAAFPFFEKSQVTTSNQGEPLLMDGGFVGNNPTLFAIADAHKALGIKKERIKVLSLGVGQYPEPEKRLCIKLLQHFPGNWLARKTFDSNTNTLEILRGILFQDIECVRVSDSFSDKQYETDLLESDVSKLKKLHQLGRESYAKHESEIIKLFEEGAI